MSFLIQPPGGPPLVVFGRSRVGGVVIVFVGARRLRLYLVIRCMDHRAYSTIFIRHSSCVTRHAISDILPLPRHEITFSFLSWWSSSCDFSDLLVSIILLRNHPISSLRLRDLLRSLRLHDLTRLPTTFSPFPPTHSSSLKSKSQPKDNSIKSRTDD